MIRLLGTFVCALVLAFPVFSTQKDSVSWSFPKTYPSLLSDARKGDEAAQNELCEMIYKGIMRYPSQSKERDRHFFGWLEKVGERDSFARRVARLFFMKGDSLDFERTVDEMRQKAEQGDPFAQRSMGSLYFYTKHVENNQKAGVDWYTKAANQGHARAQLSLALRYLDGIHTEKNISEGMTLLKEASDAGLAEAQNTLSHFYFEGRHVRQDFDQALQFLKVAANAGDTTAQTELACLYFGIDKEDWPIAQDKKEGAYWLERAYKSGDVNAIFLYGSFLIVGEHLPKDVMTGVVMMKTAAELGHKEARVFIKKIAKN